MTTETLFSLNLSYWVLQTVAMLITAALLPRLRITSIFGALLTVVALAFVNSKIWDAALFFQIPDSFSTQAGLLLLTNGIIFWILVKILPGIEVDGFLPALVAPVVFTLCSVFISQLTAEVNWPAVFDTVLGAFQSLKEFFGREFPHLMKGSGSPSISPSPL